MTLQDIEKLFQKAKETQPWAQNLSLREFAQIGAQATGDPEMARVAKDRPLTTQGRKLNQVINSVVNATPLDEWLGEKSGNLAEMFGIDRQVGEDAGAGLLRGVADVGIGSLVGRLTGSSSLGMATMGGLGALETLDKTNDPWQAAVAAVAPAGVSKAMQFGGDELLKMAAKSPMMQKLGVTGGRAVDKATTIGPRGEALPFGSTVTNQVVDQFKDKAVAYVGAQAAGQVAGLGLDVVAQGPEAVFNKDYLFANMVGNLAFLPLDAGDFIGSRVISQKVNLPPEPAAIRTPQQQRAFEFDQLLRSLDPVEKQKTMKSSGMDIASQVLQERNVMVAKKQFADEVGKLNSAFENDWKVLQQEEPAVAAIPFDKAMEREGEITAQLAPKAKLRIEEQKVKMAEARKVYEVRMREGRMNPSLESLQAVALDDLQLNQKLLNKPVKERTLQDYEDALGDNVSSRGKKILYALHKLSAGENLDAKLGPPVAKDAEMFEIASEVQKVLTGQPTKFAEDVSFIALANWANKGTIRAVKQTKEKIQKRVRQGAKVKEAVKKEGKRTVNKVRGADKKPRKLNSVVTDRIDTFEAAVMEAGQRMAVDKKNIKPEDLVLKDLYVAASKASDGDPKALRQAMSFASKIWMNSNVPLMQKLKVFRSSISTILWRAKSAENRNTKVSTGDPLLDKIIVEMEKEDAEFADLEPTVKADGVVERELDDIEDDEAANSPDEDEAVRAELAATDGKVERMMLEMIMQKRNLPEPLARQFLNDLSPDKTRALWKHAENALNGIKSSAASADGIPKIGNQQMMSLDEWANTLLKNEGFTPEEIEAVKPIFGSAVEMFYSPEVRYGFLDEFPIESKFARGYVGVVGEGGVRMKRGELNQITHADVGLEARLGETKFRFREDTGELFLWSSATEVELENLKAKLEKAGHQVKAVKRITQGNIGAAHGIDIKYARAAAGPEFDFAMAEFKDGKLLRPGKGAVTTRKDNTLSLQEFKVAGGQLGPLQDGEINFYKQLVPEAFEGDRVNVKTLWEGLQKASEQIKVVTYGQEGGVNPIKLELDRVTGELDIIDSSWQENYVIAFDKDFRGRINQAILRPETPENIRALVEKRNKALAQYEAPAQELPKATSYYNQISPFDTKQFPVLRVDVVLPQKILEESKRIENPVRPGKFAVTKPKLESVKWQQDDLHENLPNTLGWAMVQIVPDPKTGENVMFVGEVQSRWSQERSRYSVIQNKDYPEFYDVWYRETGGGKRIVRGANTSVDEAQAWIDKEAPPHAILPIHQNLILKSVIKEAQKRGIRKVAISDSETAMMTERHDKRVNIKGFASKELAEESAPGSWDKTIQEKDGTWTLEGVEDITNQVAFAKLREQGYRIETPQEGGMRLAYDTTLPSLMKKLVGDGQMEDFGVHKNAAIKADSDSVWITEGQGLAQTGDSVDRRMVEAWNRRRAEQNLPLVRFSESTLKPIGSPVFRNADGTPKTNVTARVYDITSPSERVNLLFARQQPDSPTYAAAHTKLRDIFFAPSRTKLSKTQFIRRTLSLLTHENSHILLSKARSGLFGPEVKQRVDEFDMWVNQLNGEDAEIFVDVMGKVWLGEEWMKIPGVGDVMKNIRNKDGNVDGEEVQANVMSAFAAGIQRVKNPTKVMTMLPRVVRDMFDWVMENLQSVWNAARLYVGYGGDKVLWKQARGVQKLFAELRNAARKAEQNLSDLAELANLRDGDILDFAQALYAKGSYGSTGIPSKTAEKYVNNWVMRGASLANTYEGLRNPFLAMKTMPQVAHDMMAQFLAALGLGKYKHTGLKVEADSHWMKIRKSEPLEKMASSINLEMQKLMRPVVKQQADGSFIFDVNELTPESKAKFLQFSEDSRTAVAQYFVARHKANKVLHGTIIEMEWRREEHKVRKMLFRGYPGFKGQYQKATEFANKAFAALKAEDSQTLNGLLGQAGNQQDAVKLGDYLQSLASRIKNTEAEYAKNPNFGSLRRFQPIKMKWRKGDDLRNKQANTAKEAEQIEAEMLKQGFELSYVDIASYKAVDQTELFDSLTKKRLMDMEGELKRKFEELPLAEEVKAELRDSLSFVEMIERAEVSQSVFSTRAHRRFAEGVEDLRVLEQDLLFAQKALFASTRAAMDSQINADLLNPDLDAAKDAKDTFVQIYENFKNQSHPVMSKTSKAVSAWFIGLNIPGHVAELMQPVMTHLSEMRYAGVSVMEAMNTIIKSSKDIAKFYLKNGAKFAKGQEVHLWESWGDKDEKDMFNRLKHVINANPMNYTYDEIGFAQGTLMKQAEFGGEPSLMEKVASPATAYGNLVLKFYNMFTRHNAIAGLLNGYRTYRSLGMSHEEAVAKTELFEAVVNKSGGRADRQASPFKGNSVVGHLFYGLSGYTTGWMSQLINYYRHGYKSQDYAGFKDNPQARKNAQRALQTQIIAQLAMAGIMGFPFVGALITLLEAATGEDIRGQLYEKLEEATGDPLLAQAASHGVAAALAEKLGIPADLHSRFAIGGFLGFNAYDGFSAASLLGPTGGMINSMWKMGTTFSEEHDLRKALAAGGPTGIKNIAKALDEELATTGESPIGVALGFKSGNERRAREFERIAQKRNEKAAREVSHAARRVQEAMIRGPQWTQQVLFNEARKLVDEPEDTEQVRDMVMKIGAKVKMFEEQKRFPKDIREVATPETAAELSGLARAMGVNLPPSQEVERERLKQGVYQMMGLPYRSSIRKAMEADFEANQNQFLMR